jgi:hypothetical protein
MDQEGHMTSDGETTRPRPAHRGSGITREGVPIPPEAEASVVQMMARGSHGFIFSRGRWLTRAERRRAHNREWIRWALGPYGSEWGGSEEWGVYIWTPAQKTAVYLFYELGLPLSRAARVCRVSRQKFNARLTRAEDNAKRWYDAAPDERPRLRQKKGRATPELDGTVGT